MVAVVVIDVVDYPTKKIGSIMVSPKKRIKVKKIYDKNLGSKKF